MRALLTINVVAYLSWQILRLFDPVEGFVWNHLALNPGLPGILLEPWQLVTYNFLHLSSGLSGLIHIGFNMLWLYWIGREFERMHGSQQFWTVYLVTGVSGGVMCLLLQPLFPNISGSGVMPVVGASASVLGVIMCVAILYPYKQIRLLFFGVVRLLYVVVGFLIIDALLMLSTSGTAVAAMSVVLANEEISSPSVTPAVESSAKFSHCRNQLPSIPVPALTTAYSTVACSTDSSVSSPSLELK